MSHLKNLVTGAVTESLDSESEVYRKLISQTVENKPKWEETSVTDIASVVKRVLVAEVPALDLAVNDTVRLTPGAEEGGEITSAEYTPDADITGAETNSRTLTVVDVTGSAGTTLCTLAFTTAAVKAEAGVAKAFAVNSAALTAGHPVEVASTHAGTGIADPGGIVTVEVTYTA